MFDFHVHTHHSFDGFHPANEMVEKAIALGLTHICLTDHIDYDYDGEGNEFTFSYAAFFDEFTRLRQRYQHHIHILAGVEFGLQPHLIDKYELDAQRYPFDYIIGSLHSAKKTDIYTGPYFENRNQQQAYLDYYDDMLQLVAQEATFDALGHFDMIKRYGSYDSPLPLTEFQDIVVELFRKLIPLGKGIEVNTSGFRYGLGDAHPSQDLLKLYKASGGEIIVLGSDAHKTSEIGYRLKDAINNLHLLGYKYVCTFEKRKPIFHTIEKLL